MNFLKIIGIGISLAVSSLLGFAHPQTPVESVVGGSFQTPEVRALFETTLASRISSTDTSFTLVSATDKDGTALASSTYGFIIDEGTSVEEMVVADCTSTACSNASRGISARTGTSSVTALKFAHNRGATVKITDGPSLVFAINVLKGTQNIENILTYASNNTFSTSSYQVPSTVWVSNAASTASTSALATVRDSTNTFSKAQTFTDTFTANGAATFNAAATFASTASGLYATASSSFMTNGRGADLVNAGAADASLTVKGIVEIASQLETASSTAAGNTTAPLVIAASTATSTYNAATAGLRVVVTRNNGTIDPNFIQGGTAPTGAIVSYVSTSTPPTGWLWTDGSAVSRTTYATLFSVIGTTYGVGDGVTTFNLPLSFRKVGGVQFMSASSTSSVTGSSMTWTQEISTTSEILIVAVHTSGSSGNTVSSVTYNGTTMTRAAYTPGSGTDGTQLFYLTNPTIGKKVIVATFSGNMSATGLSVSYTGIIPTSPLDTTAVVYRSSATTIPLASTTASGATDMVFVVGSAGEVINYPILFASANIRVAVDGSFAMAAGELKSSIASTTGYVSSGVAAAGGAYGAMATFKTTAGLDPYIIPDIIKY
jgi:microcystin-dependent protein